MILCLLKKTSTQQINRQELHQMAMATRSFFPVDDKRHRHHVVVWADLSNDEKEERFLDAYERLSYVRKGDPLPKLIDWIIYDGKPYGIARCFCPGYLPLYDPSLEKFRKEKFVPNFTPLEQEDSQIT